MTEGWGGDKNKNPTSDDLLNFPLLTIAQKLLRASDRGRIGVFYAFKMPKMHWR
jgi:hypothetical protein